MPTKNEPLLYFSADDVRAALPMAMAIETSRDAFSQLVQGQVRLPIRQCLQAADSDGVDLLMPCHSTAANLFSLKTVTVFPGNRNRGLPTIQALVILTDGTTGSHRAILDGTSLTALRTGAVSGLATELMARKDAAIAAIFGAGVQARTQLEAICCARPIIEATVYDPNPDAAACFAADMSDRLDIRVSVASTPEANVTNADVVCTATSATDPVVPDASLKPGVHINAVGAYRPEAGEIAAATVCRARVVVDHLDSALEEAGDLLQPLKQGLIQQEHFRAELGDVVLGKVAGRKSDDEITLFKSVGVAIQDLCAAVRVLENGRRLNLGTPLT